ncbi:MAG TPA: hypothetical protein VM487_22655 [Phycisphaerae bacterium]|nr:hypothetical protein [Phycisphaerae bacterium]
MPTAVRKPLKPITPGQIKALHAIGRRRGLSHEDLRAAAGVQQSLKELSVVEASKFIDQLQVADYRGKWRPRDPDRASARNVIRVVSARQRTYLIVLFEQLGWSDDKARAWLLKRHSIRDVGGGVFSAAAATAVIVQLEQALKKRRAALMEAAAPGS